MEHTNNSDGITWEDLTTFFMKSLIENNNNMFSSKTFSRNTLSMVTDANDPQTQDMALRLSLVNPYISYISLGPTIVVLD